MKIKEILFFQNGNTCVFDENGKQIPKLQTSWLLLYIDFLKNKGIKPEGLKVVLPSAKAATIFKIKDGYNWKFDNN